MDLPLLKTLLIRHEGLKLKPYRCTAGKLSIGYGRNMDDNGITEDEADMLLDHDIERVCREAKEGFPWFEGLSGTRQVVIADMIFNLGVGGLKEFKKMCAAIEANNFEEAATEMLASHWASQVGNRAIELAPMMRNG